MEKKQPSVDNLAKLQAELEQTRQQRSMTLEAINRTQPTTRGQHMADVTDNSIDQLALLNTLEKKISAIQHTINRINQGLYGICIDCQRKIPKSRLEVHPTAKRCFTCQTKHETEAK